MRIEAESLRITAIGKMPNGNPFNWTISLPVDKMLKAEDPESFLFVEVVKLLRDFPDLVDAYLKDTE